MPEKVFVLTEKDHKEVKALLQRERSRRPSANKSRDNTIDNEEMTAPEVYVAKTGALGISALVVDIEDTGTGTGTEFTYDRPGYEDCYIYQIVQSNGVPELHPIGGFDNFYPLKVYNIGSTTIPGNSWVKVQRDKYGSWLADKHFSFNPIFQGCKLAKTSDQAISSAPLTYVTFDTLIFDSSDVPSPSLPSSGIAPSVAGYYNIGANLSLSSTLDTTGSVVLMANSLRVATGYFFGGLTANGLFQAAISLSTVVFFPTGGLSVTLYVSHGGASNVTVGGISTAVGHMASLWCYHVGEP